MKLTLPLPNYGKIARIYFGSWEDIEVRGKFRAFGVFFVLDNVGTLEELLFDSIIGKLNLSDNPFQEDLIQTLENSINRQLRPAFDAETAIQSIKSRLITVQNLTRIYKTQELRLMAKSLGIPLTRKSKKILAKDILILLIKDERD